MENDAHAPCAPRKTNIELLRLMSIIMIIAYHIAYHSNLDFPVDSITANRLWIQFIRLGGKVGVNIFILISGYFLITAPRLKISKAIKLWLQIFTYSAGIYLIHAALYPQSFHLKTFVKNALPLTFSQWWFASCYFLLYLLSPYINKLLHSLNQKEYQRLILLLFLIWCVVPTFLDRTWHSNKFLWFVFLYALAGYMRLYIDISSIRSGRLILLACAVILLTFFSTVVLDILGLKNSYLADQAISFYGLNQLPVLLISLLLFLGFASAPIGYRPWINTLSSACFGIYLIHDSNYIRGALWNTLFQNAVHQNAAYFIAYTLMQIIAVFAVCAAIELLRKRLLERAYLKPLDAFSNWLNHKAENSFSLGIFSRF